MLGYVTVSWLREHIPLKQGLRLPNDQYKIPIPIPQRAYSIKTRIKTPLCLYLLEDEAALREHIPLKQGLRHCS